MSAAPCAERVDHPDRLRFEYVLLPLDGSALAPAALPTARALAARFQARLQIISVADDEDAVERLRVELRESLDDVADDQLHVAVGANPAHEVTARSEELSSCLVCMSTNGRGRLAGTLLGSVTREVLQSSRSPLIAVGPLADRPGYLVDRPLRRPAGWPEPLSVGGITACVDGTAESEAVLPEAARWAATLEMGLSVFTVADETARAHDGSTPNRFGPADLQRYVDELAQRWQHVAPCVGVVALEPLGVAAGVQAHLADHPAALLALTTHARSGVDRFRLGAMAADIVHKSSAPGLVVPLPQQ